MKICEKCKTENDDKAEVCANCGEPLNEKKPEKKDRSNSLFFRFFSNLCFYLSSPLAAVISFLATGICVAAIIFFNFQREKYSLRIGQTLEQSCVIMLIVFSFFLIIAFACFVISLVCNAKRQKKKRAN